jgi:hypothetical protein
MAPARRGTSAGEARGGGQSERSRTRRPPRPAHLPKVDGQQALVQGERALDAHDPHEGVCGASVQRPARVLIHQPRLEHLQPKVARARLGRARREAPTRWRAPCGGSRRGLRHVEGAAHERRHHASHHRLRLAQQRPARRAGACAGQHEGGRRRGRGPGTALRALPSAWPGRRRQCPRLRRGKVEHRHRWRRWRRAAEATASFQAAQAALWDT